MHVRYTTASMLVIPLTVMVAGCTKTPRDRLQGRWLGESIEQVSPDQMEKATGWVKGTAIEFSGSKVTVTIPAESPRSGTFKIIKVEGESVIVSFQREEGGHDEAEMQFVGERTLRWNIGNGRAIMLTKAQGQS